MLKNIFFILILFCFFTATSQGAAGGDNYLPTGPGDEFTGIYDTEDELTHFTEAPGSNGNPSGDAYNIAIETITSFNLEVGDEVAVFDGENVVGAKQYDGSSPFSLTSYLEVTVAGNVIPGAVEGNPISIKVWDQSENLEYQTVITFDNGSDGTFNHQYNGFLPLCKITELNIQATQEEEPNEFSITLGDVETYPNSTISIPVNVNNPDNIAIISMSLNVSFQAPLTVPETYFILSTEFTNASFQDPALFNNANTEHFCFVGLYTNNLTGFTAASGLVGELIFNIPENVNIDDNFNLTINSITINELGVTNFTEGSITIIPNSFSIDGNVQYYYYDDQAENNVNISNVNMPNVNLTLDETENVLTNENGDYNYPSVLLGDHSLQANNDDVSDVALGFYDVAFIAQHFVLNRDLTPYQMIAGDIDGNQVITMTDVAYLSAFVVGNSLAEGFHERWIFLTEALTGADNEFPTNYQTVKNYNPLNSNLTNQDFIAIKVGDVSGNLSNILTNPSDNKRTLANEDFTLELDVKKGETVDLSLFTDKLDLQGVEFSIVFDENILQNTVYETALSNYNFKYKKTKSGCLKTGLYTASRTSFDKGNDIANMKFIALKDAKTYVSLKNFNVNEELVEAKLINNNLAFDITKDGNLFLNIYPNPVIDNLSLTYTLDDSDQVKVEIYDTKGVLLKTLVNEVKERGSYNLDCSVTDLQKGLYFCKLSTSKHTKTERLIIK